MQSIALERRQDGSAFIFDNHSQYQREPNGRWLRRTSRGWRTASEGRAQRLERIFQRRDELKQVYRFPRLKSALEVGQPVFHAALGYGVVTAIAGSNITFSMRTDNGVTHTVKMLELITKGQAEVEFGACYFSGGAKAWRRAAGKWASLYKNLCLMEGKGAYGDWLKRHELNRSSIDDLIRRFEDEVIREAEERGILPESGKTNERNTPAVIGTSPYVVTARLQGDERTPDPENDGRQKNIQAEILQREGIPPTHHNTILYLQRRYMEPETLARYHAIREQDKKQVDAIMQRKIDEGIEEVLALAPAALPRNQKPRVKQRPQKRPRYPQQRKASNVRA